MTSGRRIKIAATRVDILVFGAHADDVELSCGGTVALAVAEGRRVGIVDLTHGEMGTRGTPQTRLRESQEARKALGAEFRERLDFGDGGLRTGRDEEQQLIRLIRRYRPSIVIAPLPDEVKAAIAIPAGAIDGEMMKRIRYFVSRSDLTTAT